MKIAFIQKQFPQISNTFILNQITGLLDMGHEVEIFSYRTPKEEKIQPDIEKYRLFERVHYFNMPDSKIKRILMAIYLIIVNFHKGPSEIIKSLNIFRYGKKALSLNVLYTILPFLNKSFDIIHCHFGSGGIIGVQVKELGIKGKFITTFYGRDISAEVRRKGNTIYEALFQQGDVFVAISNHIKKCLIALGCDERKIVRLPLGINPEIFCFREKKRHNGEKIKILTVARLVEKKGLEYSIRAVAKIMKNHPNIEYNIAGGGPLKDQLELLISELGVKNSVKLLGVINRNGIIKLYEQSHIFVLSSVTARDGDQEGQGLVLQEAQAVGLPVISTFHNGIPEGAINGKSGFLVPERNVDALSERIEFLIEHPRLWPEMGRFGRAFVEKNYNIKNLIQQLVRIYEMA